LSTRNSAIVAPDSLRVVKYTGSAGGWCADLGICDIAQVKMRLGTDVTDESLRGARS
jgi:hypothetical protein